MIGHMQNVLSDAAVYQVSSANVYRNPLVPTAETGGIGVDAAGDNLPAGDGHHDGLRPLPGLGLATASRRPCSAPRPPACSRSATSAGT